ncbi:MAG: DUF1697 domain-containing protein [Planctomycetota bacterium]
MNDKPARNIGLLRGINVGGRNKLPMTKLRELFELAGASDVETYIQSGNIVFALRKAALESVSTRVRELILKEFGFETELITRTGKELLAAIDSVPFEEPQHAYLAFLSSKPAAQSAKQLEDWVAGDEQYHLRGRELYLCLPNGVAKTKLTNARIDKALGTISTVRNWKTVERLGAMVASG